MDIGYCEPKFDRHVALAACSAQFIDRAVARYGDQPCHRATASIVKGTSLAPDSAIDVLKGILGSLAIG